MSELIVVGFKKDLYRASQVLNILSDMNSSWAIDLSDAVTVYREYNGKLRVDQSYQMTTGQGAAFGSLVGGILGGILAIPFTAGASAAAAAATALAAGTVGGGVLGAGVGALDAATWKEDFGISEEFVKDVSTMVRPGDSAIFALLRTIDREAVIEQFKGYGGTILSTTLSSKQLEQVEKTLQGQK
jgi:uncharacterized membrane protein